MTIEGAIAQLQDLIDSDGIPFWAKPSLRKVMETVEMEREQHLDVRKTGKWEYRNLLRICSSCGEMTGEKDDFNDWLPDKYCPNCGAKMEVDE